MALKRGGFKQTRVAHVSCSKCGAQPLQPCFGAKGLAHRERYWLAEHKEQMDLRDAERRRNAAEGLS